MRGEARKCIESEKRALITLDMQDELLGVGMPCGGMMDVYIEPVVPRPRLLIVGHGRIAETLAELGFLTTPTALQLYSAQLHRARYERASLTVVTKFDGAPVRIGEL